MESLKARWNVQNSMVSEHWAKLVATLDPVLRMRRSRLILFTRRHTRRIADLVCVALHLGGVFMRTRR